MLEVHRYDCECEKCWEAMRFARKYDIGPTWWEILGTLALTALVFWWLS